MRITAQLSLAVAATIALVGCGATETKMSPSDAMTPAMNQQATPGGHGSMAGGAMTEPSEAMSAPSGAMSEPGGAMSNSAMSAPAYVDYVAYSADMKKFSGQRVVLFFAAKWCPACRAIDEALLADSSVVPPGVTFVKVDYDEHTELRKQHGVTVQHTFVEVDPAGNSVKKWVATSLDDALAGAKK